ncbi:hypothetical protein BG005_011292 [Podila minutissima]|nr:hypothetical protein BG005_011292 [Podila minutissima]
MVKKIASKSSGNAITNFIRSEITAPEKRAGNTSIAISVTVFGLAVTFLRSLGDIDGDIDAHSKGDGRGTDESLGGVTGTRVGGNRELTDGGLHGGTDHAGGGGSQGVHGWG